MVLGGGAHHGGPADVDVLDGVVIAAVGPRHGGRERVQIHREQVDGLDVVIAHHVLVDAAAPEQTAVDLGMQGLDAAAHDFRKAGVLGHFLHRDAVTDQQLGGAPGGQQFDASLLQLPRKFDDARLSETLSRARRTRLGNASTR